MPSILYRYTDHNDTVMLEHYHVIRETPRGKWVVNENDEWRARYDVWPDRRFRKFVLNEGRKRFAHETTDDALRAFLKRKEAHLRHLLSKVEMVKAAMEHARAGEFGYQYTLLRDFL